MQRRSQLGRVRGLGSAKDGTAHWWAQRVTAIALIPLLLWFVAAVAARTGAGHAEMTAWMASPFVTVMLILLIVAGFHHAQLGVQVVIEDYMHSEWRKIASILIVKFAAVALAVAAIVSVLKVAFSG